MRSAGVPWQRAVVAKLETGRRETVGVDELLALAWVLGVPPTLLLLPVGIGDELAVTADVHLHRGSAAVWLSGDEPLGSAPRPAWLADTQHLRLYRSAWQAFSLAMHAYRTEMGADHVEDTVRELAWSLDQLADAGLPVQFVVPEPLAEIMRDGKMLRRPETFDTVKVHDRAETVAEYQARTGGVDRG